MLGNRNASSRRIGAALVLFSQFSIGRTFDSERPIDVLTKDVDFAIEQGASLGVPKPLRQAARLVSKRA